MEDYRTIRVYKLDGTATVEREEREELGSLEAYEGMLLLSGDRVQTQAESWLYFQMDEDKYAMLEPESLLRMEASGTSADSKTYLSLEYGSLAFRVDNVEEAAAWLKARGIETEPIRNDPVNGGRMTFFRDPDDLPLELHE